MTTGTTETTTTAMTTGTARTSGTAMTAMTTGTGVMSQDTIDRRQSHNQGARQHQSQQQQPPPRPPPRSHTVESHRSRADPHSSVFPGWASALDAVSASGQAAIINPVLLYRDSNPLRSVSLRPSGARVVLSPGEIEGSGGDGLEDSLTLNPATTGINLTLAVGSNAKSLTIVDMARPFDAISIRHELQGVHRGSIYCSDWSRDGALLASGSNDKTIRIIR